MTGIVGRGGLSGIRIEGVSGALAARRASPELRPSIPEPAHRPGQRRRPGFLFQGDCHGSFSLHR